MWKYLIILDSSRFFLNESAKHEHGQLEKLSYGLPDIALVVNVENALVEEARDVCVDGAEWKEDYELAEGFRVKKVNDLLLDFELFGVELVNTQVFLLGNKCPDVIVKQTVLFIHKNIDVHVFTIANPIYIEVIIKEWFNLEQV